MRSLYLAILMLVTLFSYSNSLLAKEQVTNRIDRPGDGQPIQYNFGHQYQIQSKILSEERRLLIYTPEEYKESTDKFPVVYILEGNVHFKHAVISIEKIQQSGWMPASIIVAITDNENTNMRDYVKETDRFLRFINQEVQPFVTKNFRINDYKTLFGHRDSGKFVLETFIENPYEFDSYIAANPYFRKELITKFEDLLDKNKTLSQSLYFSVGTVYDNGSYNVEPVKELAELLKKKAPKSLQWKYQYLPLHGSHSSANVTLYDGLSFNFTDYQGPFIYSYQDYVDGNKMEGVKAYFQHLATKYHMSDEVTMGTFMGLGFVLMDDGHPQEAAKLLINTIKNRFPESIQLHRVLGRAYEKMSEYKQAIKAYERMVLLAKKQNHSRLDDFKNQLERIKKKI